MPQCPDQEKKAAWIKTKQHERPAKPTTFSSSKPVVRMVSVSGKDEVSNDEIEERALFKDPLTLDDEIDTTKNIDELLD